MKRTIEELGTGTAYRCGQMEPNTKATGWRIERKARAHFGIKTVIGMKGNSKMISRMDLAPTIALMEPSMKEFGSMMSSMVKAWQCGRTLQHTKAITSKETSTELESISGRKATCTVASGKRIRLKALALTSGQMAGAMKATGNKT